MKSLLIGVCIGVLVCIAAGMCVDKIMHDDSPVGYVNEIVVNGPDNSTRVYYTDNKTVINVVAPESATLPSLASQTYKNWSVRVTFYEYVFMKSLYAENSSMWFDAKSNNSTSTMLMLLACETADRDYGVDYVNVSAFDGKPEFNAGWPSGPAPNDNPYYWIANPVLFVQDLRTLRLIGG